MNIALGVILGLLALLLVSHLLIVQRLAQISYDIRTQIIEEVQKSERNIRRRVTDEAREIKSVSTAKVELEALLKELAQHPIETSKKLKSRFESLEDDEDKSNW